jgi:hypothetical protein
MIKPLVIAGLLAMSLTGHAAAETAQEFAQRLQQHFSTVSRDQRVIGVARHASPSNITVEFGLTPEGKLREAKVVHSIVSQEDQQLILDSLNDLPPFAINGYADYDVTYRLPVRLEVAPPPPAE